MGTWSNIFPHSSKEELNKLVPRTETIVWNRTFEGDVSIRNFVRAASRSGVTLNVSKFVDDCSSDGNYGDGAMEISVFLKRDANVNKTLLKDLLIETRGSWPYLELEAEG